MSLSLVSWSNVVSNINGRADFSTLNSKTLFIVSNVTFVTSVLVDDNHNESFHPIPHHHHHQSTITTNSTTTTITTTINSTAITTRIVETSTINNWSIPQERLLGTDLAAWGSPNGEWLAWAEINNSLVTSGEAEGCGGIQYNTYQYVQNLHNFAPLDESEYSLDVYLLN